ncbi:16S rRNA (guanine(527)-N(7))-methyltransferase RsmG [Cellulosilyticum lentocellum]|uniref:Ribosomal RNA small subunit methyltransferase G n=1 Tax=Cellulosilyticum lentocellum (strain ATCC 49066 / DSM 5427 / NCIMB 11756 / RHM5) TaxID=642492 RepID=F2JNP8_CELLD|nr:16S rRNA (guanine(527)-N(7))-methyltransferase RsmG [Cellulosilyticum lentocellum]ADZ85937.1 methyltransferase GidB [Cellulosilyticum lentocellum DSM 5427]
MKQLLLDGAKELGINLTETQLNQFMMYKSLLQEWNEKMNLTAITEDREVMTKHFLDCMTIQKAIDMNTQKTVIDIGTGAGFPGLVIKIAFPHLELTLVDALKKRLTFLEEVINQLGLKGIKCIHSRAEDLGKNKAYREGFDICASRAVANLAVLSEYTLPFVKIDGYLMALKGQKIEEELEQGKKAIKILGGQLEEVIHAGVPFTELDHKIAKIRKVKPTATKYPRKAGEPTKAPLGV